MATYKVLDVSKYNTVNDYTAAVADIDGVIIRCGYRGYGSSGTLTTDSLFETHIAGFKGRTKIGIYWFTQAITEAEAIAEANYVYNLIKNYTIDFPVYIDSEYSNTDHDGRADSLDKPTRTTCVIAFCERIKELGYRPGVYASDSWYNSNLNVSELQEKSYSLWVARYSSNPPQYVSNYDGWQYTSSGMVNGIPARIDLSTFYNDVAGWEVLPETININDLEHSLEYDSIVYTGQAFEPEVTLENLTKDRDFTVEYVDNINVGTGKVIVKGIAPLYSGTINMSFEITRKDISGMEIKLSQTEYSYNNIKKEPTVTINGLIEGTDFEVEYSDNVNAGTATAKAIGICNYSGTTTANFTITPMSISNMYIYTEKRLYKYTGSEITPKVFVSQLTQGTEYTVTYENNIEIGTGKAIATGIGNYNGTISCTFEISEMDVSELNPSLETNSYVYDGTAKKPNVIFDGYYVEGVDYSISYENNINAGVAKCIVTGLGDYSGTTELTFYIYRKNITGITITLDEYNYKYQSNYICPEFEIEGLKKDIDYRVTYSDNFNIGTAKITIEGIGNYIGNSSTTFEIAYSKISDCIAKLGTPSVYTIYRIDGKFAMYANESQYKINHPLVVDIDYVVLTNIRTRYTEYNLATVTVKGLSGYTGLAEFHFRVIDKEPEGSLDYIDDGVYNFGYIDENDETAIGMYDFGDTMEAIDPENIAEGDYDFDKLSGLYLDWYDEDNGFNIGADGEDKPVEPIPEKYPDDGTYNFGDIDVGDITAEGDYDFGCLDCGIDPDTAVEDGKDYDFNVFCNDGEAGWIDAGTIFKLYNTPVYAGHHSKQSSFKYSNIIYIYNSAIVNGRIRVARIEDAVDSPARILGWCIVEDLMNLGQITKGEVVIAVGNLYEEPDGSGDVIEKDRDTMYVRSIIENTFYPYGLANTELGAVIGYTDRNNIFRLDEIYNGEDED